MSCCVICEINACYLAEDTVMSESTSSMSDSTSHDNGETTINKLSFNSSLCPWWKLFPHNEFRWKNGWMYLPAFFFSEHITHTKWVEDSFALLVLWHFIPICSHVTVVKPNEHSLFFLWWKCSFLGICEYEKMNCLFCCFSQKSLLRVWRLTSALCLSLGSL